MNTILAAALLATSWTYGGFADDPAPGRRPVPPAPAPAPAADLDQLCRTWRAAVDAYHNAEAAQVETPILKALVARGATDRRSAHKVDRWVYWARPTASGHEIGTESFREPAPAAPAPTMARGTDLSGTIWEWPNRVELQAWLDQRNAQLAPPVAPPYSTLIYRGTSRCGPSGCPTR